MHPQATRGGLFQYSLTVGLPHTNLNGLAEPQLLMHAGHFQWNSIAQALGKPMSALRTREGHSIYATYYYLEEYFPLDKLLPTFGLEQDLLFINRLKHFKGVSIDGEMVFDRRDNLIAVDDPFRKPVDGAVASPYLHMCNVFISREKGNEALKMAPPEGVSFDRLETLPLEQNAYARVRAAGREMTFGLITDAWEALDKGADHVMHYPINPDRDTNGAGLVYFANYVAFIDMAERQALERHAALPWARDPLARRSLHRRHLAYFANIALEDTLRLDTSLFKNNRGHLGVRTRMTRLSDGKLVALSEAEKVIES